jgi:hypothetical protein
MAEDGITDHAFAKRKAAKQLGASDTQHLPGNQEIDEALHSYRALYQHESHPDILYQLREEALAAMRLLEPFHPYLTGSVLSGTAGEHSDIINQWGQTRLIPHNTAAILHFTANSGGGKWHAYLDSSFPTNPSM